MLLLSELLRQELQLGKHDDLVDSDLAHYLVDSVPS